MTSEEGLTDTLYSGRLGVEPRSRHGERKAGFEASLVERIYTPGRRRFNTLIIGAICTSSCCEMPIELA